MSLNQFLNTRQPTIFIDTLSKNEWFYHRKKQVWVMISKQPSEEVKRQVREIIKTADILKLAIE
jgi:hypothetical protein